MTREMNNSIQNGEKYTKTYKAGLIISAISAVLQFVLFFMWIDTNPIVACMWLVAFVITGVALIFNAKRVKKNETAGCVSFENITHDDRITIQHLTAANGHELPLWLARAAPLKPQRRRDLQPPLQRGASRERRSRRGNLS